MKKVLEDFKKGKISGVDIELIHQGLIFCYGCGVRITFKNYGGVEKIEDIVVILCKDCYNRGEDDKSK